MIPAYVAKHFTLEEFLPKEMFEDLAAKDMLWKGWLLMDERIVRSMDNAREKFGVITINNWHRGGDRHESGLRVPGMKTFKPYSQHSFGRACDGISASLSGDDMRRYILQHPDDFPYLHALEKDVAWLHADCRNCERITLVSP